MKQRGSALIISMMLIASIGAVAFGIAKLFYADTSLSSDYENGIIAYYAAESGIEEGFLRYKYNMNTEVPFPDASWVFNDTKVFRTNLTDESVNQGTSNVGIDPSGLVTTPTKQIYDLRVGYLGTNLSEGGPFYYHDVNKDGISDGNDIFNSSYSAGDYNFLRIPKDEARTFDLSNIDFSTNDLSVGFKFIGVGSGGYTPTKECQAMAEVKFLITSTAGVSKEYKALTSFNPATCASLIGIEANKLDVAPSGGYKNANGNTYVDGNTDYYYSLNDILTQTLTKAGATITSTDKVVMTIKPLYYPADVAFLTMACNGWKNIGNNCTTVNSHSKIVTGPYSYISSTGYYGGTTRTLTANIDRQSGTIYDLYSYVLFKGTN